MAEEPNTVPSKLQHVYIPFFYILFLFLFLTDLFGQEMRPFKGAHISLQQ